MIKYFKSTNLLNVQNCPKAIMNAHKLNEGFVAILNVLKGSIKFVYDDNQSETTVGQLKPFIIEANRLHHVEFLEENSTIRIDFYKL